MKKKIAVVGAGPAGVTAAYELSKENISVDLYEASNSVGGMAKTIELWDQKVDIGPHRFFSSDPRVNKIWLEVTGKDYKMVNRLTRIYYKRRFYFYPLKVFNVLSNMGVWEATLCILSYLNIRLFPMKTEHNFTNWVTNRFGKRLFSIFFKTYTEKLWGISCDILDSDFAAQRIKKLSLYEAVKNAILGGKGNKHKTLVDQFAYPMEGTGMVYERMAKSITEKGNSIHLKTPVKKVKIENNSVTGIELENGTTLSFDHVISSMPMTLLVSRIENLPEEVKLANSKLKFRNTIIVYVQIDGENLFPDQWLYVHSAEVLTGRITNFHNWVPSINKGRKETILALEYWCYDSDSLWKESDLDLINRAFEEVKNTNLNKNHKILNGFVYKIPRCYPVYETGYKENLEIVQNYLKSIKNLDVIGRYGSFKYNNQDHSILMGYLNAQNIIKGENHNLWEINTDYEYQESSKITESGLEIENEK
jgi:protoporphyrinogen oxidase